MQRKCINHFYFRLNVGLSVTILLETFWCHQFTSFLIQSGGERSWRSLSAPLITPAALTCVPSLLWQGVVPEVRLTLLHPNNLYQPLTCECKRGIEDELFTAARYLFVSMQMMCTWTRCLTVNVLLHVWTSAARHRFVTYLMCTVVACSQIPWSLLKDMQTVLEIWDFLCSVSVWYSLVLIGIKIKF